VRKAIFSLGFFLVAACSGSQIDSDSESGSAAASAGEDSSSGGSGPNGGSSKGGSGASAGDVATGGDDSGGSNVGGAAQGGGGYGGTSGSSGTAGSASGGDAGMATAGSSGRAGGGTGGSSITDPVCDPPDGIDNTDYPDCEPRDAGDACELCIQSSCCEESKVCYGYDPANVCGWGGPMPSPYDTVGEIDCYVHCARAYVEETGVYDDSAADLCVPACTTAGCGLIGNATQDLIMCIEASCEDPCFAL
jgi:hypothetical protein